MCNVKQPSAYHIIITVSPIQAPCPSTAPVAKSKGTLHNRDESFSSSIQSNDSVFTDTDLSSSLQTSGRLVTSELQQPSVMGSSHSKVCEEEEAHTFHHVPVCDVEEQRGATPKAEEKRSPKDSGYGSRLNTDDLQSPSHSESAETSPRSMQSVPKEVDTTVGGASATATSDSDEGPLRILTLANSPVLVNKSYRQFYYVDDLAFTLEETSLLKNRKPTPTRGKYPKEPILPGKGLSKSTHDRLTIKSITAIKSASCSSLDRLSLTSSLEEYASNLAKEAGGEDTVEGNEEVRRERLLSVTHFETLTANLETPQCATIVKVAGSSKSPSASSQKLKKHRKHLLSRLLVGKRKTKAAAKLGGSSDQLKDVVITAPGQAPLRKKNFGHGRRRMVVSDDLTHKVNFEVGENDHLHTNTASKPTTPNTETKEATRTEKSRKSVDSESGREKELCRSAEHASPRAGMYIVQENHIGPFSAELSQSLDCGLSDLKQLEIQLRKLAQPSQSTTHLDLSQRVLETSVTMGLRVSHSADDLSDPMGISLSQTNEASRDEPPREGFLWRVLGRASQRWPALIQIVSIQSNQSGMSGFGVRKGQTVRALYRVSGQVIVETETNHMACIPYECCRISTKYYGRNSKLVQLSYSQLYVPVLDGATGVSNSTPHSSAASVAPGAKLQYINAPIEMVAIQDNYECLPLDEINVEAGEKLRVLYCDHRRVYAVKENGKAGLLARNYCRLTRRSEKMYQQWVELTLSPFQADHPVEFGKKPPSFLFDGTLSELKPVRSKPPTPEAQKKLRIAPTSAHGDAPGRKSAGLTVHSIPKTSTKRAQKPLPPTPPVKRRENTVSPLAQNGFRSPVRQSAGLRHRVTPPTTAAPTSPLQPMSPSEKSKAAVLPESNSTPSNLGGGKAVCETSQPSTSAALSKSNSAPPNISRNGPSCEPPNASTNGRFARQQSFSYSGKLMTVVQNYSPRVGRAESVIRKGVRVRVVRSSPDGKTLRVATKTGTQFDIPVTHVCMSRKNSEPSPFGHENDSLNSHEITLFPNRPPPRSAENTLYDQNLNTKVPMSPPPASNLPLECGKIMTVIRSFVPTPDDPMVTIRRGLRVKVLGGQDNQVKVVTKTGTTFHIPRSHLRLSHKTSDASAFSSVDSGKTSPPKSPPTQSSAGNGLHTTEQNGGCIDRRMKTDDRARESSPSDTAVQASGTNRESASSSINRTSQQQQQQQQTTVRTGFPSNVTTGGVPNHEGVPSLADTIRRGCRVNSTGSQVFELC